MADDDATVRCSLSLEAGLLAHLDQAVGDSGAANRSGYIRSLLRDHLGSLEAEGADEAVACLTLLYDHHASGLSERLVTLQHDAEAEVLVTTHLHLSHHTCLELIVTRGSATAIRQLEGQIRQLRGVERVSLSLT